MVDDKHLTINEAHRLLKTGQLSSVELTKAVLERIHRLEPKVRATVTITDDLALKQAQRADKLLAAGDGKPLSGIPLLIKDNICTEGIRT
ncbi:MAG: amidase family protein, partial [Dehalococcoidales bacterium]